MKIILEKIILIPLLTRILIFNKNLYYIRTTIIVMLVIKIIQIGNIITLFCIKILILGRKNNKLIKKSPQKIKKIIHFKVIDLTF